MHVSPLFALLPAGKHALIHVVGRTAKAKAMKTTIDEVLENEARPCGYTVRTILARHAAR